MADKTEIIYDLIFNTQAASQDIQSLNAQLKTIQDNMTKIGGASQRAGAAVVKTGRAFRGAGQSIQNASFQVADFATQVSGGVDASRALAQQLPQLLGGMGALGAGIGAAVAIILPLGQALAKTRDYAQELQDGVEKLDTAQKISSATIVSLTEDYGRYAGAVRTAAQAQTELARLQIESTLTDQAKAVSDLDQLYVGTAGAFGELVNQLKNADFGRSAIVQLFQPLDEASNKVNFLKDKFSLTDGAAKGLMGPFMDFQNAVRNLNTDGAALALQQFSAWINQNKSDAASALPILDAMTKQFEALSKVRPVSATQASSSGMSFTPNNGANGYSNYKGDAIVAQQLAAIEQRVADAKRAVAEAAARAAAAQRAQTADYERFVNTIDRGVTPLQRTQELLRQAEENFAQFQSRMSPEQIATYTAYISDLNTKISDLTFKDRWEQMSQGISSATSQMTPLADAIKNVGDTIQSSFTQGLTDAFMAFIDGTKSAQDAFKEFAVSFIKEITAMIIKSLILYVIQTALGAATGSTAFGALMQQFGGVYAKGGVFRGGREVKAFATGGVVNTPTYFPMAGGKTGLMGEAGPEAIVPLTRRNGKLGVGSAPVNVVVNNNSDSAVRVRQERDRMIIDVTLEAVASDLARGGGRISNSLQQGYGLRRAGR